METVPEKTIGVYTVELEDEELNSGDISIGEHTRLPVFRLDRVFSLSISKYTGLFKKN